MYNENENSSSVVTILVVLGIFTLIGLIALGMWGLPKYRFYKQDLAGQSNLRQQEWEKKIAIEEAKARNESANMDAEARVKRATAEAQAEIVRAEGVARANEIIAKGLKDNEEYLRYLWIQNISSEKQVIYVPTEAGLPILEANRLK